MNWSVLSGDCRELVGGIEPVDAVVCDPPYGLSFMGKGWDHAVPGVEYWSAILGAAKPGAHLVAFGGTRQYHRLTCAIEDAGWEIRDCLMWLYGSGFCKGFNMKRVESCDCGGNAIPYDHAEPTPEYALRPLRNADLSPSVNSKDQQREVLQQGLQESGASGNRQARPESQDGGQTQPVMEGRQLHRAGQGVQDDSDAGPCESETERVCLGAHSGRGEDAGESTEARRGSASQEPRPAGQSAREYRGVSRPYITLDETPPKRHGCCPHCGKLRKDLVGFSTSLKPAWEPIILARKPLAGTVAANVCEHGTGAINVDGCRVDIPAGDGWNVPAPDTRKINPARSGSANGTPTAGRHASARHTPNGGRWPANLILDGHAGAMVDERSSGASRFFYSPKADRSDRDCGNNHPTVKPVDLMRWLCRLVTPPGGTILDPFTGSGSTGVAANRDGFHFIGCELNEEYARIARDRIAAEDERAGLFATKSTPTP